MQNKTAMHTISPGHAIKQMPNHPKIMQVGPRAKANQCHDPSAQYPHQITITRNSCSLPLLFVCKEILNQFRISSTSQVPSCVTLLSPRSASAALHHAARRETPPPSAAKSASADLARVQVLGVLQARVPLGLHLRARQPLAHPHVRRAARAQGHCRRTDQFIRVQVQWQPASGRTVILEPI